MTPEDRLERILLRLALRFTSHREDVKDLMQEGRIAAWQAGLVYDPHRGASFLTYVVGKSLSAMRHYIRRERRIGRPLTHLPNEDEDGCELTAERNEVANVFSHLYFEYLIEDLIPSQRELLRMRFAHDLWLIDIAELLGVAETTVQKRSDIALRLVFRKLRKLREE